MSYEVASNVEERVASLFQTDVLLSAQYYDSLRRKASSEPETRLMLAILEDAVACFQNYIFARDSKGKRLFNEAEEWILQEADEETFSFKSICDVLGFNPACVRQALLNWKKRRLARTCSIPYRQSESEEKGKAA
jgi:hypothetical protein